MHLRNRAIFILLCCLNTLKVRGVENRHLEKKSTSIQHLNYSKISLQVVQGNSVQIHCDISLTQTDISWIEWRRDKSTSPVLVKFVNYQAYIDPVFSNRLKVDGFGNLLIDPALAEDSAVYKCKTYTLENHIPTFFHGTTVELNVEGEPSTAVTQQVRLGYPGLIDCQIDNPESSKLLLAYTWTKDNIDVTIDPRFSVLTWGSMFIRRTTKEDAGLYECIAKTLNDESLPKVYRGIKVNLDILYPPIVLMVKETVMATLGSDVYLPCTSQGNPSLVTTKWLWNEEPLPKTFKYTVFPNGTLYLRNAQKDYEGIYKCTPFNEVGLGKPETTSLKIEVPPVFTILPPKTLIAKLGDNLAMVCRAVDSRIIWRKIDSSLPEFRSTSRGGSFLINNVQLEDSGKYECKASSFTGSATQTVEVIVISTPLPPIITNVGMLSTSAVISWKPGYNGGSRQTIEIWYRRANSDDYHWEAIIQISGDETSYTIYDLEPEEPYLFSLRGVNRAGFGFFSDVFHTETMSITLMNQDKQDKPMPPGDVGLNQTKDGYLLSWSYNETPGRPQVHYFIIEYRALNSSLKWKPFKDSISWDKRKLFIDNDKLDPNSVYEFRMFSFGGVFSEPSSVIQTKLARSTISPKSSSSSTGILIMVCVVSVSAVVLFASSIYCFCFKRKRNKKVTKVTKINRKYAFPQPHSSTESNLSDSENDSCDLNDVKLIPNLSTFVRERQENVFQPNLKKVEKTTKYDYKSVTLGDKYVARAAANMVDKSNAWHSKPTFQQQDILPEHCVRNVDSREDMPTGFKSGCLLPEFPELRDSYDQFCTTPSEYSSREELEGKRSIRDLDIHSANGARVLGTSYAKYSSDDIPDSVHLCKRRKKTIFEEASDAHERYQRWSMPEFTKLWYETMDSDSESTVTDQTEIVKEHQELSPVDQSTQVPSSAMTNTSKSNGSPNPCRHLSPSRRVVNQEYGDTEEQISGNNGNFFLKESVSCPAIGSTQYPTNFHSTMYDSSGFCEDNVDSSASSSPTHSRVLVNTASKNGECDYWHESHFSENDRLFVTSPKDPDDSILEATTSTCEASVCASDSGYSGMSNGTRDSPEGEEQDNYDPLGDKRVDILSEPHLFKTLKHLHEKIGAQSDSESEADNETSGVRLQHDDLQSNSIKSNPQSKTHLLAFPHIIIENTTTEAGRKDERCAQLMEEFRVNKTMNSHLTRSSLYRTYEV